MRATAQSWEKGLERAEAVRRQGDQGAQGERDGRQAAAQVASVHPCAGVEIAALTPRREARWASFCTRSSAHSASAARVPQVWDWFSQTNIKLMVIAEILVLVLALRPSRSCAACRGAGAFPLRGLAVAYTDFLPRHAADPSSRFVIAFGLPSLKARGSCRTSPCSSMASRSPDAHLHRVRDGGVPRGHRIGASESAHGGAPRSGWTYAQTMRHVILPQAIRRVRPAAPETTSSGCRRTLRSSR